MNTIIGLQEHSQGYNLPRKEVIEKFRWREGLIPLSLSKHAQRRVEERVDGEFPIVPTVCRITKENICSGRSKDGKKLTSVKIRLDYKTDKWMFLVVCPNSGVVKTLYINYKDAKKERALKKKYEIKEECCIEEPYYDLKEEAIEEKTQECETDRGREVGTAETLGLFSGNLGRTTTLLRNIRNFFGIRTS